MRNLLKYPITLIEVKDELVRLIDFESKQIGGNQALIYDLLNQFIDLNKEQFDDFLKKRSKYED